MSAADGIPVYAPDARAALGAEAGIPLPASLNAARAGRYDRYRFAGRGDGRFSYNGGLEWRPARDPRDPLARAGHERHLQGARHRLPIVHHRPLPLRTGRPAGRDLRVRQRVARCGRRADRQPGPEIGTGQVFRPGDRAVAARRLRCLARLLALQDRQAGHQPVGRRAAAGRGQVQAGRVGHRVADLRRHPGTRPAPLLDGAEQARRDPRDPPIDAARQQPSGVEPPCATRCAAAPGANSSCAPTTRRR